MSESKDYNKFKTKCAKATDRIDRVENIMVVGMPDVNYCIMGNDGWIEFKSPIEPKRERTPLFGSNHKITQEQKNWFLRQRNAGGNAYFLIATDKRWLLIDGEHADNINTMSMPELIQLAIWHQVKPIEEEEWKKLRQQLANIRRSRFATS